jgi:hypothetical protein
LLLAPEYSLEVQARIPAALAAIHNFISIHNPHDQPISSTASGGGQMYSEDVDVDVASMEAPGPDDTDLHRDMIAQKMWDDYVQICTERGIDMDTVIDSDLDGDDDSGNDTNNNDSGDDGEND